MHHPFLAVLRISRGAIHQLDFTGNYANEGLIHANIAGVDLDSASLSHTDIGNRLWSDFSANFAATTASLTLTLSSERATSGGYAGGLDGVSLACRT